MLCTRYLFLTLLLSVSASFNVARACVTDPCSQEQAPDIVSYDLPEAGPTQQEIGPKFVGREGGNGLQEDKGSSGYPCASY